MSRARLFLLVAAACLAAVGVAVLSRGSRAATPAPVLPKRPVVSAPTLAPVRSSTTDTTVQRTFVSTAGSDTNDCTATSPCRSFAAALAKTTAGGEVVALTSGGYGPVGIGMAVTIVGAPGVHAAITAPSGDAIDVEALSSDTVVLRNLYLNGLGTGTEGINYSSGHALQLEQVTVTGFSDNGVEDQALGALYATDVVVRENDYGVLVDSSSSTSQVALDRVRAEDNSYIGIYGFAGGDLRVSDCIASGNQNGVVTMVPTMVSACQLSGNIQEGFILEAGSTAQIGGSTVTDNGTGIFNSSGSLQSFGDNLVAGNGSNTFGTITTIAKT